ncbi:MAG: PAS domain-containing protein [Proteobacteria bacterium]|nr:PAS domain-containing protein [Pseudomonadota bacterium]MBU1640452.1 PAS domain-containing protein [Pseudomonadota bacterium]
MPCDNLKSKIANILSRSGSIRSKVWTCVLIALVGYFIATLSSFYSNSRHATRLTHLQKIEMPLALLSDQSLQAYKDQIEKYENAFLTGEAEQAIQGNRLSGHIVEYFEKMQEMATNDQVFDQEKYAIAKLLDNYNEFSDLASEVYLSTQAIETSIDLQKKIQVLGSMQTDILNDLRHLAQHFTKKVEDELQEQRRSAQINTLFLGVLFVVVLVTAILISHCFASQQLIEPLAKIQTMVKLFAKGEEIYRPQLGSDKDEISNLAFSFWEMTQDLKDSMVSRDYVDSIIKNMSGCLMVLTPGLQLSKINTKTSFLLDRSEDQLLGLKVTELVCDDMLSLFQDKAIKLLHRGEDVTNLEICLTKRDGSKIPVLFSGSVMRNSDNVIIALICVTNDITERKKTEQVLRKNEIERALAQSASLARIGELTSSIAHEMRNPLSSIKMTIKTIAQELGTTNPTFHELATIAQDQSKRLETMLNDLLSYGKPLTPKVERTTFHELLTETFIAVAPEKEDKSVSVEITDNLKEIPLKVDKELMIRALSNLALNAIQWSPARSTIYIASRLISIVGSPDQAIIEVRDSGPGLDSKKSHRLFQPFMTTRPGGTGLGLANVRKIVEYHGGTVSGCNYGSGGALFTITIPIVSPHLSLS